MNGHKVLSLNRSQLLSELSFYDLSFRQHVLILIAVDFKVQLILLVSVKVVNLIESEDFDESRIEDEDEADHIADYLNTEVENCLEHIFGLVYIFLMVDVSALSRQSHSIEETHYQLQ